MTYPCAKAICTDNKKNVHPSPRPPPPVTYLPLPLYNNLGGCPCPALTSPGRCPTPVHHSPKGFPAPSRPGTNRALPSCLCCRAACVWHAASAFRLEETLAPQTPAQAAIDPADI